MAGPRKARVSLVYKPKKGKKRNAASMAEYMEGFSFEENADGEADVISLELTASDNRFGAKWKPRKGDTIMATLVTDGWDKEGKAVKRKCGRYFIDTVTIEGPEYACKIEGTSVPEYSAFRAKVRNQKYAWLADEDAKKEKYRKAQNVKLKKVAEEIAKRRHMKLRYSGYNPTLKKAEQGGEPDCDFLTELCQKYGQGIKVTSGKIVIYSKAAQEKKSPKVTLNLKNAKEWQYETTTLGSYLGGSCDYSDRKKETVNGREQWVEKKKTVKVGKKKGVRILKSSGQEASVKLAQVAAAAAVDAQNEGCETLTATVMGNFGLAAGNTAKVTGAGRVNGKYYIDKATHTLSGDGYETEVEMHKVKTRLITKYVKKGKKKK